MRQLTFGILQVLGIQFLQHSLSIALSLIFPYVLWDTMSSHVIISDFLLFPDICPSTNSLKRLSPLKMCPSHRFSLSNRLFKGLPFSFTISNTYSLMFWSFQLIFSILHNAKISKASNLSLTYFLSVQVSDPCAPSYALIAFFFRYLLILLKRAIFSRWMHF